MDGSSLPVVSMLWETVDPYATLTERFAFAGPGEAAAWLRTTVADHWGIGLRQCRRLVLSAGNGLAWLETDVGELLAKWTIFPQLHERLAELARLVLWLHERGLPVSPPLAATDGRLQVALPNASLGLQQVRTGELLDPADPDQVHDAGAVLGRLHLAMADYPRASLVGTPQWAGYATPLVDRIKASLAPRRAVAVPKAESALRSYLDVLSEDSLPERQLAHHDIRSANLLCTGSRVTSVLDFEETGLDYAVSDLAKGAVMLGTRFRNWRPVDAETHRRFLEGYEAVRCLSSNEKAWLPAVMVAFALGFASRGEDPAGWAASAEDLVSRRDIFR